MADADKILKDAEKAIKDAEKAAKPLGSFDKGALDGPKSLESDLDKVSKGKLPKKALAPAIKTVEKDLKDARDQVNEGDSALKELSSANKKLAAVQSELEKTLKEVQATLRQGESLEKSLDSDVQKAKFLLKKAEVRTDIVSKAYDKLP